MIIEIQEQSHSPELSWWRWERKGGSVFGVGDGKAERQKAGAALSLQVWVIDLENAEPWKEIVEAGESFCGV